VWSPRSVGPVLVHAWMLVVAGRWVLSPGCPGRWSSRRCSASTSKVPAPEPMIADDELAGPRGRGVSKSERAQDHKLPRSCLLRVARF
jgi:hypothetical protein